MEYVSCVKLRYEARGNKADMELAKKYDEESEWVSRELDWRVLASM